MSSFPPRDRASTIPPAGRPNSTNPRPGSTAFPRVPLGADAPAPLRLPRRDNNPPNNPPPRSGAPSRAPSRAPSNATNNTANPRPRASTNPNNNNNPQPRAAANPNTTTNPRPRASTTPNVNPRQPPSDFGTRSRSGSLFGDRGPTTNLNRNNDNRRNSLFGEAGPTGKKGSLFGERGPTSNIGSRTGSLFGDRGPTSLGGANRPQRTGSFNRGRSGSGSTMPPPKGPDPNDAATKIQVNQTYAISMMASPVNVVPFPLAIPLGIALLLGSQAKGKGSGLPPRREGVRAAA
ncbi:hypothetical protein VTJ04DRAFT_6927 [Mycothermus thermophilus]|uniref:uncharacterized protein n=1 Tax=Humicola insolens TaxID=85995 RepID=UPI00374202C9